MLKKRSGTGKCLEVCLGGELENELGGKEELCKRKSHKVA